MQSLLLVMSSKPDSIKTDSGRQVYPQTILPLRLVSMKCLSQIWKRMTHRLRQDNREYETIVLMKSPSCHDNAGKAREHTRTALSSKYYRRFPSFTTFFFFVFQEPLKSLSRKRRLKWTKAISAVITRRHISLIKYDDMAWETWFPGISRETDQKLLISHLQCWCESRPSFDISSSFSSLHIISKEHLSTAMFKTLKMNSKHGKFKSNAIYAGCP